MREYYGAMLKMGAMTFWEDFDLAWTENSAPIDEIVPEGKKDMHGDFGAYCYKISVIRSATDGHRDLALIFRITCWVFAL